MNRRLLAVLGGGLIFLNSVSAELAGPLVFTGMSDASAAVAIGGDRFVAANDEDNILRCYRVGEPGEPVQVFDLNRLWSTRKKSPEMDLEGAARIGQHTFWIGSHGRNADGEPAPRRHALFALELSGTSDAMTLCPAGRIYTNLIADLSRDPRYVAFDLAAAATCAPKAPGGLSIEALTETPEGSLLIGFRNPVPAGRALFVPLLNPLAVVEGHPPRFGDPLRLDLGGLGLRGAGRVGTMYYLIASHAGSGSGSRLFVWQGHSDAPRLLTNGTFSGLNPEGICFPELNGRQDMLLLSDDSVAAPKGKGGKSSPESERRFRAFPVRLTTEEMPRQQ